MSDRYRFEHEAMKIVEDIKRHLLPAMEVEEGGWILGRILDLAQLIERSPPSGRGEPETPAPPYKWTPGDQP